MDDDAGRIANAITEGFERGIKEVGAHQIKVLKLFALIIFLLLLTISILCHKIGDRGGNQHQIMNIDRPKDRSDLVEEQMNRTNQERSQKGQ